MLEVFQNRETDGFSKANGDGIADHLAHLREHHGVIVRDELVVLGKCLEQSALPETDCTILFGMTEAPVAIAKKLGRDGRRRGLSLIHI